MLGAFLGSNILLGGNAMRGAWGASGGSGFDSYEPYALRVPTENAARHIPTATGTAALDGSGGVVLDGNSDSISIPDSDDWTFDDMCIRGGVELASYPADSKIVMLCFHGKLGDGFIQWGIRNTGGTMYLDFNLTESLSAKVAMAGAITIPLGTKHYFEVDRSGDDWYLWFDGELIDTATYAGTIHDFNTPFVFGAAAWAAYSWLNGTMSQIEIAKVARNIVPFTPPTEALVDSDTLLALNFAGDAASQRITDSALPDSGTPFAQLTDTSGNDYDGVPTNDPVWVSGDAIVFDGTNYVSDTGVSFSGERTHYFRWNFTKPVTTDDYIFGSADFNIGMTTDGYIFVDGGTKTEFVLDVSGVDHSFSVSVSAAGQATVYVDGVSLGSTAVGTGANTTYGLGALNDGSSPIKGTAIMPMLIVGRAYEAALDTLVQDIEYDADIRAQELIAEAEVAGADLALTNTATGARQSTMVGGTGRTANLALWSEAFDNATWNKFNSSVTANQILAPNGELTADKITKSAAGGRVYDNISGSGSTQYTVSVYAKSGTLTRIDVRLDVGALSTSDVVLECDLSAGTASPAVGDTPDNYSITDAGNGWYRITLTATSDVGFTSPFYNFYVGDRSSATVGDIYLWGAQLTKSATALPYVKTEATAVTSYDSLTLSSIPLVASMAAATNLVSTDLTTWTTSGGGSSALADLGGGMFTMTLDGSDTDWVVSYSIASAANDRTHRMQARLVSGSITSVFNTYMAFRGSGTVEGTSFDPSTITSEWQDVDFDVTSADTTDQIAFRFVNDVAAVIEIRNMRAVDLSAPAAAFVDGSGAAEAYAVDNISCSPDWGTSGTLMQVAVPYGWSGSGGHPVSFSARLYEVANVFIAYKASIGITGSGATPEIATGGMPSNGVPSVISFDFDGVNIGARYGTSFARTTAAESDVPAGVMYIGNKSSGDRAYHAAIATLHWKNKVLTDAEYEAVRVYLVALFSAVVYQ